MICFKSTTITPGIFNLFLINYQLHMEFLIFVLNQLSTGPRIYNLFQINYQLHLKFIIYFESNIHST